MRGTASLVAIFMLASAPVVAGEEPPESHAIEIEEDELPGVSYLWDGGALPFFWGALAGRLALDQIEGRDSPLFFSPNEGGMTPADWQVPGWAITGAGAGIAIAMAAGDDPSRWYHAKGLAESLATGSLVTGAIKLSFGRHRPDHVADDVSGGNRSFPSGHATQAFAIATYTVLYLRGHGFEQWRPRGTFTWWEGAAYAGIYLGAASLAAERVLHHRHHLSDVLVGSTLGSAASLGFYLYQERRYQRHRAGKREGMIVLPLVGSDTTGIQLSTTF
jgi:membrane-associated phospholipid phosphatase